MPTRPLLNTLPIKYYSLAYSDNVHTNSPPPSAPALPNYQILLTSTLWLCPHQNSPFPNTPVKYYSLSHFGYAHTKHAPPPRHLIPHPSNQNTTHLHTLAMSTPKTPFILLDRLRWIPCDVALNWTVREIAPWNITKLSMKGTVLPQNYCFIKHK